MYTVAADADNELLNDYGDFESISKAKKTLKKAFDDRYGFAHGKIVDENGQIIYQHKAN